MPVTPTNQRTLRGAWPVSNTGANFARCSDAPVSGRLSSPSGHAAGSPLIPRAAFLFNTARCLVILDHDIRVWLSAEQYAGLVRLAKEQDRAVSATVRRLICLALDESVDHDPQGAMPGAGLGRDRSGGDR